MKKLIAALLCVLLFLSGCALGTTELLPKLQANKTQEPIQVQEVKEIPAETEIPETTEAPTEAAPTLESAVKDTILGFTTAYFTNNTETMFVYLSSGFEGDFTMSPSPEAELVDLRGLETAAEKLEKDGRCELSLPFRAKPEDDFYTYLSLSLVPEGDGVKVAWYGLEG